jgi:pimeloyl-ACP methyl ester carboxylesterase
VLDYPFGSVAWAGCVGPLARDHTVVVPEWPDATPLDRFAPLQAWVPVLLEAVNLPRALLVCWSLGAPGALRLALEPPSWLRGLVLVDPAGLGGSRRPMPRSGAPTLGPEELAKRRFEQWIHNPEVDRRPLEQAFVASMAAPRRVDPHRPRPAPVGRSDLHELAVSSLIVTGARSDVLGPEAARELAAVLSSDVVVFDHSAHAPHLEEPTRFAQEVRRFTRPLFLASPS